MTKEDRKLIKASLVGVVALTALMFARYSEYGWTGILEALLIVGISIPILVIIVWWVER